MKGGVLTGSRGPQGFLGREGSSSLLNPPDAGPRKGARVRLLVSPLCAPGRPYDHGAFTGDRATECGAVTGSLVSWLMSSYVLCP